MDNLLFNSGVSNFKDAVMADIVGMKKGIVAFDNGVDVVLSAIACKCCDRDWSKPLISDCYNTVDFITGGLKQKLILSDLFLEDDGSFTLFHGKNDRSATISFHNKKINYFLKQGERFEVVDDVPYSENVIYEFSKIWFRNEKQAFMFAE